MLGWSGEDSSTTRSPCSMIQQVTFDSNISTDFVNMKCCPFLFYTLNSPATATDELGGEVDDFYYETPQPTVNGLSDDDIKIDLVYRFMKVR